MEEKPNAYLRALPTHTYKNITHRDTQHTHTHIQTHILIHTLIYKHIYSCTHTLIYKHIHSHIYTHTHTHFWAEGAAQLIEHLRSIHNSLSSVQSQVLHTQAWSMYL